MNIIKSFKAGIALGKWQRENSFLFTFQKYEGISLFILSDPIKWQGTSIYAHAGEDGIYVSQALLDSPIRDFVLAHELGHIKLGHLNKGVGEPFLVHCMKRAFGNKVIINREYEADVYAASVVGNDKAIEALQYMLSLGVWNTKELNRRIANLGLNL